MNELLMAILLALFVVGMVLVAMFPIFLIVAVEAKRDEDRRKYSTGGRTYVE